MGGPRLGYEYGLALPLAYVPVKRKEETEADALAVRIMRDAGYDPEALPRYVDRVQGEQSAALPERSARVDALKAAIQKLPGGVNGNASESEADFLALQASVREVLAGKLH